MPSEFAAQFIEKALPKLIGRFGEPITFDGDSIEAIVGAIEADPQQIGDSRVLHYVRTLTVQTSQVPAPKRAMVATIDSLEWTVHEIGAIESGHARLILVRPVKVEGGGRRFSR